MISNVWATKTYHTLILTDLQSLNISISSYSQTGNQSSLLRKHLELDEPDEEKLDWTGAEEAPAWVQEYKDFHRTERGATGKFEARVVQPRHVFDDSELARF